MAEGNISTSPMLKLKEHLLSNYDGLVRPVKDGVSPTVVTYRMLLYALLDMVNFTSSMFLFCTFFWQDES